VPRADPGEAPTDKRLAFRAGHLPEVLFAQRVETAVASGRSPGLQLKEGTGVPQLVRPGSRGFWRHMGLVVTIVNGPRRSGKSTIIREMVATVYRTPPHYLRLTCNDGDKVRPAPCAAGNPSDCGVASAAWVEYDPGRVFEVLPEALAAVAVRNPNAQVIIEADADPSPRQAFTYHARLFVMRAPDCEHEVFRSCEEAAGRLQAALNDTSTFATEVFGLCGELAAPEDDSHQDLPGFTPLQMQSFLHSPLGRQLALRSQLQPAFHAILDSDVIVMNTALGGVSADVDATRRRLDSLVTHIQKGSSRRSRLFCCDFMDPQDPLRADLFGVLRAACSC